MSGWLKWHPVSGELGLGGFLIVTSVLVLVVILSYRKGNSGIGSPCPSLELWFEEIVGQRGAIQCGQVGVVSKFVLHGNRGCGYSRSMGHNIRFPFSRVMTTPPSE